jgi:hypothetical protein
MFDINDLATAYIYIEYIIPAVFLLAIILYSVISHYLLVFKIYRINKQHTVEQRYENTYWYNYYCTKCGKLLYSQPSGVNTSLSKFDYIFRYTDKCN